MMTRRKKLLAGWLILLTALSLHAPSAVAGSEEFDRVVKLIETHFRVKRKRLPFFANMVMRRAVRVSGVHSFKVAIFEDQDFSSPAGGGELGQAMRGALAPEWELLVRTASRGAAERTFIYTRDAGEYIKLLIVTIERREATVLQVEVTPQAFINWLKNPDQMGKALVGEVARETPED